MLSSVVVYFLSNVSLSYFSGRLLRTLRYSFVKCCCWCRLLFMISSFVSAASWMLHHVLDVVLRCHRRSKSTGTHSQHASLSGVHRSRRVARRCNPTHACCCGMVPRPFGTCLAGSIGHGAGVKWQPITRRALCPQCIQVDISLRVSCLG